LVIEKDLEDEIEEVSEMINFLQTQNPKISMNSLEMYVNNSISS